MQEALYPGLGRDEPELQLAGALRKERNAVAQDDSNHGRLEHINLADFVDGIFALDLLSAHRLLAGPGLCSPVQLFPQLSKHRRCP